MSIKLEFSKGTLRTEVLLKDAALTELMQLIAKHQADGELPARGSSPAQGSKPAAQAHNHAGDDQISRVKSWFSQHTPSEALNRLKAGTFPEKILLLAAFHESNGGDEGWKSSDIESRFSQAKESFPANFPRELRYAIDNGTVGAVTARTYRVGRAGWSKIDELIQATNT